MDYTSAFAVSVNTAQEAEDWLAALLTHKELKHRMVFQAIAGVIPPEELRKVLAIAKADGHQVTFLGYKTTHRGGLFKQVVDGYEQYKPVLEEALKKWCRLSIDTLAAEQLQGWLASQKVSPTLYTTHEGRFSCYIDAVASKIGASSYVPARNMKDLQLGLYAGTLKAQIKERFGTITNET